MKPLIFGKLAAGLIATVLYLITATTQAQHSPPSLGEETKGEPAMTERTPETTPSIADTPTSSTLNQASSSKPTAIDSLLGKATITESRRENGQIYRIELNHSSGAKQYIEETDSDGKIHSTSNDIEETPNLPKWKLGSW